MRVLCRLALGLAGLGGSSTGGASEPTKGPPAAPVAPSESAGKMTVPPGFRVTLAASEPDVRQPIAMTLDHRGRVWVAENFSYPGWLQPAKEKDRIVVFEDADGDGKFDRRTVFWDHGTTVTGLAVGFGGVWVCATPSLLFIPDANGDDVPDGPPLVVLDGWDVEGKHNLFNALTWGPDGWLYGCNGILSNSRVGAPGTPDAKRVPINCGVWRYHPTKAVFEAFAHGTTNPWGLDFNDDGEMFITNCVIPHVFHAVPGARFERMFGEDFNRYTYERMPSCADHIHWSRSEAWSDVRSLGVTSTTDRAGGGHAHTGAMIYLGDNWPAEYRTSIFMNNIHGHRVNRDRLEPKGSGYVARHEADFLFANDPWFRGMELRYGPDGGVYLTDWSDIGECHENDDDLAHRENGRVYKITYGDVKPVTVDLKKLGDEELASLQAHPNDWYVRQSRLVLQERAAAGRDLAAAERVLLDLFQGEKGAKALPTRVRLRALWALHSIGRIRPEAHLNDSDALVRRWAVRLAADGPTGDSALGAFARLARDDGPRVRLAVASALQRLPTDKRWTIAEGLLSHSDDAHDAFLPLMTWYGIEPLAAVDPARAADLVTKARLPLHRRFLARRLWVEPSGGGVLVALLGRVGDADVRRDVLQGINEALGGRRRVEAPAGWSKLFEALAASRDAGVRKQATYLALRFGDPRAAALLTSTAKDATAPAADRREAVQALATNHQPGLAADLIGLLDDPAVRGSALRGLAACDDPAVPAAVLSRIGSLAGSDRDDALQTLASRPAYARALLDAVARGVVPARELPVTLARQIQALGDKALSDKLAAVWGTLRPTSKEKAGLLNRYRRLLAAAPATKADPSHGRVVFKNTCASCHKLFDDGGDLGPELTGSDRANLDYVLQNVLDPSATVGSDFRLTTVATRDGRVLSGLLRSRDDRTLVVQTVNERVALDRDDVEEVKTSDSSVMPEGLFEKLTDDEVRDLVAYLASGRQVALPAGAGR